MILSIIKYGNSANMGVKNKIENQLLNHGIKHSFQREIAHPKFYDDVDFFYLIRKFMYDFA